MRALLILAGLTLGLLAPGAMADDKDAETCIRTKIWDGYADRWAVRSATKALLRTGEYRVYVLTMYKGTEYRFQACGDKAAGNVDLVLHNSKGVEIKRDDSDGREPELSFRPAATDTYYIAVFLASQADPTQRSGVALATTYR